MGVRREVRGLGWNFFKKYHREAKGGVFSENKNRNKIVVLIEMYNIRILIILNFKVLQKFVSCHCKKTKISDYKFFFRYQPWRKHPWRHVHYQLFFSPSTFKKIHAHWKKLKNFTISNYYCKYYYCCYY